MRQEMPGRELHFILGLWLSSIFSNSSSARHWGLAYLSSPSSLCLTLSPSFFFYCLRHILTQHLHRYHIHTYTCIILYSLTPKHVLLWSVMCCLHQCILAASMCQGSFQHLLLFLSLEGRGGEICPSDTINICNLTGKTWNLLSLSQ